MKKPTEAELDALLSQSENKTQPTESELDALLSGEPSELGISNGEMLAREATKMLPIAGSLVGGVVAGAPTLGMATLGGSALGAAGGKALQNVIEQNVFDEPKEVSDYTTDLAKEAAYDVAGNITGEKLVAPLIKGVLKMMGKGYTKVASSLSGIPEQSIETLYSKYDDVTKIDDIAIEADRIREVAQKDINQFKNIQNARISDGITAKEKAPVNILKVRNSLTNAISKLDPVIDEAKIGEIHKQIKLVDSIGEAVSDGTNITALNVPADQAYALQKNFQELAEYLPAGQVFKKKNFVDLSFQKAAAETRGALNKVIPEISQANAELAKLRRLDKNINKNLITPEKSMNALVSVGSGKNPMMQKQVERLSEITGHNYLSPMQTLASAEKFANPDLISSLTTGRANIPILLAGATGAGAGGGMAGVAAAAGTGMFSTPFGIKTAVGGLKAVESLGKIGINPKNIASEYLQYQASQEDPIQQALDVLNVMQNYSPYEREQYIRKDPNLKPSERAKLLKENSKR